MVPGQRPPDRQGVVLLRRHGAERATRSSPTGSCGIATTAAAGRPGSGRRASRWRRTSPRSTSATGTSIAGARDSGLPVYDAVDSAITGGLRAEIDSSLARQGEILDLLSDAFGPYPFSTVGAIVDNQDDLFFALETQTRPVYSKLFWLDAEGNPVNGDFVVVHELAHQWFGDDVALARWQDIWLNEGFATYAEWLWEEYEGRGTPQEIFQATYDAIPADDPFWSVVIGDPGVDLLFDDAVYVRGAMTLQALRNEVGDDAFWAIVRGWAADQERRQRHDRGVHRLRRAGLGPAARRAVRHLALHRGEAAAIRGGRAGPGEAVDGPGSRSRKGSRGPRAEAAGAGALLGTSERPASAGRSRW